MSWIESKLAPAATALRKGKPPIPGVKIPGAHPVLAGSGTPAVQEAEVDEFGPKTVHVPVGGSVDLINKPVTVRNVFPEAAHLEDTWTVQTFNAGSDDTKLVVRFVSSGAKTLRAKYARLELA